jgi:hypothetical protein
MKKSSQPKGTVGHKLGALSSLTLDALGTLFVRSLEIACPICKVRAGVPCRVPPSRDPGPFWFHKPRLRLAFKRRGWRGR